MEQNQSCRGSNSTEHRDTPPRVTNLVMSVPDATAPTRTRHAGRTVHAIVRICISNAADIPVTGAVSPGELAVPGSNNQEWTMGTGQTSTRIISCERLIKRMKSAGWIREDPL